MAYEARTLSDAHAEDWNRFVASHPLGRAVVTTFSRKRWGALGWRLHQIATFEQGRMAGGIAVCTKKIPWLPWDLARIMAILPEPADVVGSTLSLLAQVAEFARRRRVLEAEVRCAIPDRFPISGVEYHAHVRQALAQAGYVATRRRRGTYIIPIDRDDESLLMSYGFKCRRDVRTGIKKGVEVAILDSPQDVHMMIETARETRSRKGLAPTPTLFEGIEQLFDSGHMVLFGAKYDNRIRNMYLVDGLGIPQAALAGTTPAAFEKGTPPTGQLLQFRIMQHFRDQGAKYYDQGGSPGPVPQKGHPNYTVWRFKHEFNGTYVNYIPYYRRVFKTLARLPLAAVRRYGRL